MLARRTACWTGRSDAAFSYAGRGAAAAASGCCPCPDCLGYGDGISAKRHAGTWRNDLRKTRCRIERRKTPDQAELRCFRRNSIGRHARRDCGRPGAGRRRVRRRAGSRGCDLCSALAAVSGDVDCGCKAACRPRAAIPGNGLAEQGPTTALSDTMAAIRYLVEEPAEDAVRPGRLSIRTYDKV